MKDRSHDEAMAEVFRKDPAYAAELLESILEDGSAGELLIALRQMAKAAVLTDDLRCWTPANDVPALPGDRLGGGLRRTCWP